MTEIVTLPEVKEPRQPTNQAIQAAARPHALNAIKRLAFEMDNADNSAARIGAAKALLAKVLPDLRSMDFTGELNADGSRPQIGLFINIGGGFIPANLKPLTTSAGSITGESKTIQSPDLAPEGTQNNNGHL